MKKFLKIDKRKKKIPELSVLFSYYNNQVTIKKSLNSILNQSYKDYEIIIISDGSKDKSNTIVEKIIKKKGHNILYFKSLKNYGLTKSLNFILKFARGKYIARHDADDISIKNRFKKQIKFIEKNKNIDVLGSNAIYIEDKVKYIQMPETNNQIKNKLLFQNTLVHSSIIMSKKLLLKYKYNEKFPRCQDYELWLRIKKHANYYNLQEYLVLREIKKDNFNLNDVYFSSLARLKHINFFLAVIFNLKDLMVYLKKKLIIK